MTFEERLKYVSENLKEGLEAMGPPVTFTLFGTILDRLSAAVDKER
jgi:hypothetical protein